MKESTAERIPTAEGSAGVHRMNGVAPGRFAVTLNAVIWPDSDPGSAGPPGAEPGGLALSSGRRPGAQRRLEDVGDAPVRFGPGVPVAGDHLGGMDGNAPPGSP